MRHLSTCLMPFLLLPLVLLTACNRNATNNSSPTENTAPPPASTASAWEWTTDTEGGFKVEMPGRPARSAQFTNHFPQCGSVNCVVFSVQNPDANFLVNYWDLNTPQASQVPMDVLIDSVRDTMASQDSAVLSEQAVKLKSGQSGRECRFRRTTGTLTVRWIPAHQRLYMLIYAGKTDDLTAHQIATARYLNSFEITGGTNPAPNSWTDYSDPDGRFRATFLGTPRRQKVQLPHPKLGQLAFDICETKEAGQSMSVVEIAVTPPPGAPLSEDLVVNELRDAHVRRTNGQISSEKPLTLQGLTGREVVVATARQGAATLRFFPYDGKYFMIGAQGLSGTPPAEDTARFLNSFQFRSVDWLTFAPTGGRFSVRFKSSPQKSTNALPGPRGQITETVFRSATADADFLVGYADYDGPEGQGASMDQILAVLRDAAVRSSGARVVSEQPIQMVGSGGRELVAELPNRTQVRLRWITQVRRVYSVGVIGLKPGSLPTEDTARFLDSFKITP